jgi:trans-aconitate methyltransferase
LPTNRTCAAGIPAEWISRQQIGPRLVAAARRNLADFPHVTIIQSSFETWHPPAGERFDLVFAATAWHWIDPALRYQRAWQLLRPGGHLAFWNATHVFPDGGDPFFVDIQDVYDTSPPRRPITHQVGLPRPVLVSTGC